MLIQVVQNPAGINSTRISDLSERGLEVQILLAQGLMNSEIAERLHLTRGTVRSYVSAILTKLDVNGRRWATILVIRHEWVVPGDWN